MAVDIIGLLSTDGYVMCNKEIIRLYGTDCAVVLGELCAEYKYYQNRGELDGNMFYSTQENIEDNTGLSVYCQRKAITKLKDEGIIDVVKKGLPAKNYFYINVDKLCDIFTASRAKIKRQDLEELNLNNNKQVIIEEENTIPINRNSSDLSDFESHSYSPEEMREEFLGSIHKKKKTKKPSLYDKCADEVLAYTKNLSLQDKLLDYLGLRLNMKDKPIAGVNQWKGMLNKLSDISGESALDKKADSRIKIVEQSIERGWAAFFEVKSYNEGYREDCAAFGVKGDRVICEPTKTTAEERKAILEKQGKRSSF